MGQENEQARQLGGFGHPGAVNTVTVVDEPEENTTIYSWRDGQLKKLPYEEHEAKTGQKIKTFMSFVKVESVFIVTVNKEEMSITINGGTIQDNSLRKSGDSAKYFAKDKEAGEKREYVHKVSADAPALIFSLNREDFGQEIKGKVINGQRVFLL